MNVVIHCDGLCQPRNPGGYACWAWLVTEGPTAQDFGCVAHGKEATNNIAEYAAVENALRWCLERNIQRPILRTDSQLVVRQINGVYGCYSPRLIPLCERAQDLLDQTKGQLEWVSRDFNEAADALSRLAFGWAKKGIFHQADIPPSTEVPTPL
jgi:ribonuclease HI